MTGTNGAQEPKLTRGTLAEMGQRLPHGRKLGDECRQDFELKPASTRVEIAVGDVRANREHVGNSNRMLVYALKECLASVGGRTIEEIAKPGGDIVVPTIAGLPFVDIITMLYYRQWKQRKRVVFTAETNTCPRCRHPIPAGTELDLGDMVVYYHEPWSTPPTITVEIEPQKIPGLGEVKSLTLKVPAWMESHFTLSDQDMRNDTRQKLAIVEGAVCGTDTRPVEAFVRPPKGYMIDLPPDTIDSLVVDVFGLSGGPVPMLPAKCGRDGCSGAVDVPFSWRETIS